MKCPRCQQENPPQAKFCLECGTALALRCANCGTQLPAGAKFCFECATPVSTSGSPPRFAAPETYTPKHLAERIIGSKAALEGERKQVTVLFADLKGSMELLADRDPEEARKILDPVLELMMDAVHRFEGTVNQVMGDGIMALFGAPLAHEDHAVRACYAALRMQESATKYAEEVRRSHEAVVKIRVGLNSGEVVVRAIGSDLHMDYTAVGQTTHLAGRMEQLADPGAILMTADTLRLAEGFIAAQPLGPVRVKGLTAAVDTFALTGAGSARSRFQVSAARGLTRFVGRKAQIDVLLEAVEEARSGHGQVAAIVGEPGVGKSRLSWEVVTSLHTEGVRTLIETEVLADERGVFRLAPGPAGVEQGLQIPATAQAMLAARIDRLVPGDKRLLQAAAVIGQDVALGLLVAIAGEPQDTVRGRLTRLQAAEFLYETRLFPDLEYTFRHALTHEVAYEGLLHDRRRQLHAAIVEAMEEHHGGRLSEHAERLGHHALRGALWEKAVTYLWQAGRNARARSAYREAMTFLEQAVEALTRLPDTVEHAVLHIDLVCRDLSDPLNVLGRYERLIEHMREAARLAEKIGDRARLASALARTLHALRTCGQLDRAVEIGERACGLADEIGDRLLTAFSRMELSSVHYLRGDLRRTEALLTQALAALEPDTLGRGEIDGAWVRRMISQNLVPVLAETGRYRDAIRRGEETLRMAEELGHPAPIAWALCYLAYAYCGRGDADRATNLSTRSLALARERDVRNLIQAASARLGAAYTLGGRATEAVACLEEAVEAGRSTNRMDAFTLVSLGRAYLSAGRPDDASGRAQEALATCRERSMRNLEASALHLLGDIAAEIEPLALEHAERHYRQALGVAEELGMRPLVAHCHLGLSKLYHRTDKREQAAEHFATATMMYGEMGMTYWLEKAEAEVRELE